MKRIIWPLIHKYNLNSSININKYPWGWISQNEIKMIAKQNVPETVENLHFPLGWKDKKFFHPVHFREGAKMGYNAVLNSFYDKDDFVENFYLTPNLSLAFNELNYEIESNNIKYDIHCTKNMQVEIIGSWIKVGNAKSNCKFLGLWGKDFIKHELMVGGIGPEIRHLWDQRPIKQIVRVLYKLDDRIDVFDWERCLMTEEYQWNISNINNILL